MTGARSAADNMAFSMTGVFDNQSRRAAMTVTEAELGEIEMIMDSEWLYMKLPDGPRFGEAAGRWVRIPNTAGAQMGSNFTLVNPDGLVAAVGGAKAPVRVGEEMVEGVPTTHYKANVTIRAALANPALSDATRERLKETLGAVGLDAPMAIDVWLDAAGVTRRLSVTMPLKEAGKDAELTVDMTLRKINEPVEVPAAPADAVDLSELDGASASF